MAAIDSQNVKVVAFTYQDKGIDTNKEVNGRKRHIVVDTLGSPIAIHVGAANEQDGIAGIELLWQMEQRSQRLQLIRPDSAYRGDFTEAASAVAFIQLAFITIILARMP